MRAVGLGVLFAALTLTAPRSGDWPVRLAALEQEPPAAPAGVLTGRVLFNGMPVPDVLLSFQSEVPRDGVPARSGLAQTNNAGQYAVRLPEWGSYAVSATLEGRSFPRQQLTLRPGEQDIVYRGAAIEVTLTGLEPGATAKVVARAGTYAEAATIRYPHKGRILPLPLLSYTVIAYDLLGRVSKEVKTVTLDEGHQEAAVAFDLEPNTAELTIRDEDGRPASRLSVSPWAGSAIPARIREIAPGRYTLAGVPAGVELHIRTVGDWMPVCRKAPFGGRLDVVLTRGRTAEVSFMRMGVAGPVGTLTGVEGSDCPVYFQFFRLERLPPVRGMSRGIIRNFPVSRDLVFEHNSLAQAVDVNADGTVVVR